jgi:hypothetical protein
VTVSADRDDPSDTVIPLTQAPSVTELVHRAQAHERITLTEAGADGVLVVSAGDEQALLDWEAAFIAESVSARPRGPYLPNDLVVAMDAASLATVEAFLAELETHAGEDIPAAELWARWERTTSA